MPHIVINCYKGRTDEQKQVIAEKFKAAAVDSMGCDPTRVSVSIRDVDSQDWKKVFKREIMNDQQHIVIKPGYTYESLD